MILFSLFFVLPCFVSKITVGSGRPVMLCKKKSTKLITSDDLCNVLLDLS